MGDATTEDGEGTGEVKERGIDIQPT